MYICISKTTGVKIVFKIWYKQIRNNSIKILGK